MLAANFVSLLACLLCGLGTYVLARRVGLGEAAALLSGILGLERELRNVEIMTVPETGS